MYTANVQSLTSVKLTHLSVTSTSMYLFWDLEKRYNHRQCFVKTAENWYSQQKNWENFEVMKNVY